MSHWSKAIFKAGPVVIWDYFSWMIRYSSKKRNKYPIEKRYNKLKKLISCVNNGFDVQIHVEGKENLPVGPFVMYPNHLSSYDPLLLASILDTPTTFVAKKEVAKYPFVSKCTRVIDGVFMDRENLKQSLKVMMHVEESLKEKKMNWIIFPEGTRSRDPLMNVKEFHHGSFRPAVKAGVPIIPVAIVGTNRVLRRKPHYKTYHVFIKFLPALLPEEYKNMTTPQIAIKVHDDIQKTISFDLMKKDFDAMRVDNNYRFNKIK